VALSHGAVFESWAIAQQVKEAGTRRSQTHFNAGERKEMIDDSTMKAVNLNVAFGYSSQARHQLALFDLRRLQIHIAGVRQVRSASSASTS
jgi:hypothetical protein